MSEESKLIFLSVGWEDYLYWQKTDKKILKRINELIKQYQRTPFEGIGKPEPLRVSLSGWWSRRVDHEHRLVYRHEGGNLYILQCRKHY
ncbi:Txe/YoeB family addiction module toxin [Tunicatimonas pelagia]|uniref:Txe/YoeB family addiction module toxin n=1 Tax=Tunicatimonas pelagia TaxID=931531 RepID=UPI002665A1A6|nr:Txe/YoeB family addiction module toxin [Tunicatimonas pelagia]WKN44714.1 Txe/YoeB family addiction module toxin [Tunicatimonas pelagia]